MTRALDHATTALAVLALAAVAFGIPAWIVHELDESLGLDIPPSVGILAGLAAVAALGCMMMERNKRAPKD